MARSVKAKKKSVTKAAQKAVMNTATKTMAKTVKRSLARPPSRFVPTAVLAPTRVFGDIRELYTLAGAAAKAGRRVRAEDLGLVTNASMVVVNGQVAWAGPRRELPAPHARTKVESLGDAVVVPGFVECHTHLIFAGHRAGEFERRNQGESYQSIGKSGGGILATLLPTRHASVAELARIGQARVERYLRQGVTTIEAKSGYGLSVEAEIKILRATAKLDRARIVPTFLGAHAVPKEATSADAYVTELIENAMPLIDQHGLARRADVFLENGYFSKELSRRYLLAAQKRGWDVVIHADQLTRSGGAELAVELGARSADHLLCINDRDIERLGASEVTCVLLPSSDLYMNSAYPPARRLIESGARVAIATDFNPGSAPSQDLALAGVLARVQMKMSLPEVVTAYTLGAAYALGMGDQLGALTPGRAADFSVLSGSFDELFLEVGQLPIARVYRGGSRVV